MGPSSVQSDDRRAIVALSALRNAGFMTSRRLIAARKVQRWVVGPATGGGSQLPLPWSSGVAVDGRSGVLLWRSGATADLSYCCGVGCCADAMPTLTTSATAASTTDCFLKIGSFGFGGYQGNASRG